MWGKTVTIELDHSDIDLTELMEVFKGLAIASGFEISSWNNVIKDLSAQIHENETEDLKEKLNEWKFDDEEPELRHNTKESLEEWKSQNGFGSWTKDSEGHEFNEFGDEDDEVIEDDEETLNKRMDIIGQNGNEGTHYSYDWDDNIKGYDYESNDMLSNINDSIQIIKDRMEDIDMRMDNIDEQLGILNADVANIELGIAFPPPNEHILKAKDLYDRAVKAHNMDRGFYKDVVDMETGEVKNDMEVSYDEDGGFATKMNKSKVTKGKIKDLKK
jgi:hypothetical protein